MSLPAFFAHEIPTVSETLRLDPGESHHALAVLRLRTGTELRLLDGNGTLARARVIGIGGTLVHCEVLEREYRPAPAPRIHVASALPKGERLNVLLEMATQLGMASFTPLMCARGVATSHAGSYSRWERICRSACKQALVRYRPELRGPAAPADFVRSLCATGARAFLADRTDAARAFPDPGAQELGLLVGPEGGFTDVERSAMLAAGAQPLRLAQNVLRVETAVVSGLAVLRRCCGTD